MLNDLQLLEDKVVSLVEALEKARADVTALTEENHTLKNAQQQEKDKLSGILSLIEGA